MVLGYFCSMLTDDEIRFLKYWEKERDVLRSFSGKMMRGLPMAVMFGLPVIMLILVVYLWLPEWYAKISGTAPAMFLTALMAVVGIIIFYAYFRMQYRWETYEEQYHRIRSKQATLEQTQKNTD